MEDNITHICKTLNKIIKDEKDISLLYDDIYYGIKYETINPYVQHIDKYYEAEARLNTILDARYKNMKTLNTMYHNLNCDIFLNSNKEEMSE